MADSGMENDLTRLEPYLNANGKAKWDELKEKADSEKTMHFSEGKTDASEIPPDMLLALGEIYAYGRAKYTNRNWTRGTEWSQFCGSLMRHYLRWSAGEDIDPESGKHHLLHVIWNATTLWFYQKHNIGTDDRIFSEVAAKEEK